MAQEGQIKEESSLGLSSGQSGQGEAEKQLTTGDELPQQNGKVGYIPWLHAGPKMPTEWDWAHNGHLSNVIHSVNFQHQPTPQLSVISHQADQTRVEILQHKTCLPTRNNFKLRS